MVCVSFLWWLGLEMNWCVGVDVESLVSVLFRKVLVCCGLICVVLNYGLVSS